jgi:myo-inositol-1-phosphate synthase
MNWDLGGYEPTSIVPVIAFDIDARKVGKPTSEAIWAEPNCALQLVEREAVHRGPEVLMAPVLDGVAPHMSEYPDAEAFRVAEREPVDVALELRRSGAHVLICYVPVGSERAAKHYAEACLEAGVAMVNCVPVFIASDPAWNERFRSAGLPIVGDDIKSQVGATIVHRVLAGLVNARGATVDRSYQLNVGGNTDFLNMLARERLRSKKRSKTEAVASRLSHTIKARDLHIGPSDYVPFLDDNKLCFLRVEATGFAGAPIKLEVRLSVEDSPNSGGVVIDAIRYAKLALDAKVAGALLPPSAYCMKRPPVQMADEEAELLCAKFVEEMA